MKVVNKYWPRLVHIGLGDIGRLIGHVFESCDLQRAHEIKFYHVARLHIAPQMSSIFFCSVLVPHLARRVHLKSSLLRGKVWTHADPLRPVLDQVCGSNLALMPYSPMPFDEWIKQLSFQPSCSARGRGLRSLWVGWCPCIFPSFDLNATESLYVETLVSSIQTLIEEICCVLAVCLLVSCARLTTDFHTVNRHEPHKVPATSLARKAIQNACRSAPADYAG